MGSQEGIRAGVWDALGFDGSGLVVDPNVDLDAESFAMKTFELSVAVDNRLIVNVVIKSLKLVISAAASYNVELVIIELTS